MKAMSRLTRLGTGGSRTKAELGEETGSGVRLTRQSRIQNGWMNRNWKSRSKLTRKKTSSDGKKK
jgi:hypothetical protein